MCGVVIPDRIVVDMSTCFTLLKKFCWEGVGLALLFLSFSAGVIVLYIALKVKFLVADV